jgi:hypothetical protein
VSAQEIVEIVGELVVDDGETLKQQHGSRALMVAQEIETALTPRLEENPAYAPLWQAFQTAPRQQAPALAGIVEVLLSADVALARRLDALLEQYRRVVRSPGRQVNTGGGAYVGGEVSVEGGDFVGRDKTTITGDGIVVGDRSSATVIKQTADPEAIARAFEKFYQTVEAKPGLSAQEKDDLKADLEGVEKELVKGEEADEGFIARRLRNVKRMAPDIWDVVITTFGNPVAGLGIVARKIAARIKAEAEGA